MSLPLSGVKVLDLSRLLPGGFCSLLLADLGADVLKVEDTGAGDYIRWAPPYYEGARDSTKSAMFLSARRYCCAWQANTTCCWSRSVPA
jgi:alpha-methylacyl-CoA racemase